MTNGYHSGYCRSSKCCTSGREQVPCSHSQDLPPVTLPPHAIRHCVCGLPGWCCAKKEGWNWRLYLPVRGIFLRACFCVLWILQWHLFFLKWKWQLSPNLIFQDFPSYQSFQTHWTPCNSLNVPGTCSLKDFCICTMLFMEYSSPGAYIWLFKLLQDFAQMSPISEIFCNQSMLSKMGTLFCYQLPFLFYFIFLLFLFFFISWRLITLQYCSGFCHTLTWISHGFTCVPHPDPPSHLPLCPIPLVLPSAPGPSTCLMHPTWASDLFHPR